MNELIGIVKLLVLFIYAMGLLFTFFIADIYFVGYVYDCFAYGLIIRIGHWGGKKIPRIKYINWIRNIWKAIQPKEIYLRYQTPLFTYCFSYMAIWFISSVLPFGDGFNIVIASVVYLLCYFCGMKRRYRTNEKKYE